MSFSFIGFTLDVIGKLLIAFVTLRIHIKHFQKHRVDKREIQIDVWMSTIGIALIMVGYLLRVPSEWA
ncbi:hypothetical protein ACFLZY_03480 [Patescibacteria group bacterium]